MLIRPGTACALNSVPRVPSNCSGLARFLKFSVPLKLPLMVTCPAIFSNSTSEPRPCRSIRPFTSMARIRSLRLMSMRTLPPTLESRTSPRLLAISTSPSTSPTS